MSRAEQRLCPRHGKMHYEPNRYGGAWTCLHPGCTVVCWNRPTSLPGDQETRNARNDLHRRFDPLWEASGTIFEGQSRGARRTAAYRWLRETLGVPGWRAHIGMLSLEQCAAVNRALDEKGVDDLAHASNTFEWPTREVPNDSD